MPAVLGWGSACKARRGPSPPGANSGHGTPKSLGGLRGPWLALALASPVGAGRALEGGGRSLPSLRLPTQPGASQPPPSPARLTSRTSPPWKLSLGSESPRSRSHCAPSSRDLRAGRWEPAAAPPLPAGVPARALRAHRAARSGLGIRTLIAVASQLVPLRVPAACGVRERAPLGGAVSQFVYVIWSLAALGLRAQISASSLRSLTPSRGQFIPKCQGLPRCCDHSVAQHPLLKAPLLLLVSG